jgi:hypothetical protein
MKQTVRNKRQIRQRIKERLFELNQNLFDSQPYPIKHYNWTTPEGRSVITLAREKIGYKSTTANSDIYWCLMRKYEEYKKKNEANLLQ